jgi:hypothetical protein
MWVSFQLQTRMIVLRMSWMLLGILKVHEQDLSTWLLGCLHRDEIPAQRLNSASVIAQIDRLGVFGK